MKKPTHVQYALALLRRGSGLGGLPVEVLIKDAADAIDPDAQTTALLYGIGPAMGNVRQAIVLLTDAYSELSMAMAEHQAKCDGWKPPKRRKRP